MQLNSLTSSASALGKQKNKHVSYAEALQKIMAAIKISVADLFLVIRQRDRSKVGALPGCHECKNCLGEFSNDCSSHRNGQLMRLVLRVDEKVSVSIATSFEFQLGRMCLHQ